MNGCVIFLLDESSAMASTIAEGTKPKHESLATALNGLLNQLTTGPDFPIAVIGYQSDREDKAQVGPRWQGAFEGKEFVLVSQLAANPLKVEQRVRKIPTAGGPPREETVPFPIWYVPTLGQKAPQIAAFEFCSELLTRQQATSGLEPAVIFHISAAPSSDGNPERAVQKLQALPGSPLVLNLQLGSSDAVPPTYYPSSKANLAIGLRSLFDRSSVLPQALFAALKEAKAPALPGARGFVANARLKDLIQFLALVKACAKDWSALGVTSAVPKQPAAAKPAAPPLTQLKAPPPPPKTAPQAAKPAPTSALPSKPPSANVPKYPAPPAPKAPTTPIPPEAAETPAAPAMPDVSPLADLNPPDAPVPIFAPAPDPHAATLNLAHAPTMPEDLAHAPTSKLPTDYGTPSSIVPTAEQTTADIPSSAGLSERLGLIVFILDRSVDDPFAGNLQNPCNRLQEHANSLLAEIAKKGKGSFDVALFSYGTDSGGASEVRSTFEGPLAGRGIVKDTELAEDAIRVEEFTEEVSNGVGGLITVNRKKFIFYEVEPTGAASLDPAFAAAAEAIKRWCSEHPQANVPPVVLHLTRGRTENWEIPQLRARLSIAQPAAGPVLLYHLIATEAAHKSLSYPGPDQTGDLQDETLRALYEWTSPLAGAAQLAAEGKPVQENARGYVINGKFDLLLPGLQLVMGS